LGLWDCGELPQDGEDYLLANEEIGYGRKGWEREKKTRFGDERAVPRLSVQGDEIVRAQERQRLWRVADVGRGNWVVSQDAEEAMGASRRPVQVGTDDEPLRTQGWVSGLPLSKSGHVLGERLGLRAVQGRLESLGKASTTRVVQADAAASQGSYTGEGWVMRVVTLAANDAASGDEWRWASPLGTRAAERTCPTPRADYKATAFP
jgi:hypothetical protein